jgi:hypothetical protein
VGAHGSFNQAALATASKDLDHSVWYVYEGGGSQAGSCTSEHVAIETIEVAINPDAGTQLLVTGIRRNGVQP